MLAPCHSFRVLTHSKKAASVSSVTELIMFKVVELFGESIPCTIIQSVAFIRKSELNTVVVLSLLISACFTSESVSYMSYIKDANSQDRRVAGMFFGFVASHGLRVPLTRMCMFGMSFVQLLSRCMTVSILIEIDLQIFALFVSVEVCAYLLYKTLRGNFRYHLNFSSNMLSLLMSLIIRVMVKMVSDFTGMVYFRHPYELGGE